MKEEGLRPQVAKYEKLFIRYVKDYDAATVFAVLKKGQSGRLKLLTNRKDRFQMIQLLGLDKPLVGWRELPAGTSAKDFSIADEAVAALNEAGSFGALP